MSKLLTMLYLLMQDTL